MNSMLNQNDTISSFINFYNNFKATGKDPEKYINELLASGKVTKEQLSKTISKAKGMSFLLKYIK